MTLICLSNANRSIDRVGCQNEYGCTVLVLKYVIIFLSAFIGRNWNSLPYQNFCYRTKIEVVMTVNVYLPKKVHFEEKPFKDEKHVLV